MISFWRIFWLEFTALVRTRTLAMLMVASVAWMLAFPYLLKGDGTAEGAHELYVHFSLGGVFGLLVIALLASATGSIASERAAKRLQLTMVRPVRYFAIALGKIWALTAVGAMVLAVATVILALRVDLNEPCSHVLSPILPSPREEAKEMYDTYMRDPETPMAVKRAKKSTVLRLLENRAVDHYQTMPTNSMVSWKFDMSGRETEGVSVRLRVTNRLDMRQDVRGRFEMGALSGVITNITQAIIEIPLVGKAEELQTAELKFFNEGGNSLMLRPRRDLNVLTRGDAFWRNLLRAYAEMVGVIALIVSIGMLLSAGLGRPVAMFVAFVALIVGEMSPSVIEQYPDELETKVVDRIGLYITRFAAEVTRPVSAMSPMETLSKGECVEKADALRVVAIDLGVMPIVLALLAGLVIPRKQDDMV